MVIIKSVNEGFALVGAGLDACSFVQGLNVGYMVDGARFVSRQECTEELLTNIESRFSLQLIC